MTDARGPVLLDVMRSRVLATVLYQRRLLPPATGEEANRPKSAERVADIAAMCPQPSTSCSRAHGHIARRRRPGPSPITASRS